MSTGMVFLLMVAAFAVMGVGRRRWASYHATTTALDETRRELAHVREMVEDLSSRFHRLETEREFYRDLLAAPAEETSRPTAGTDPDPVD